MTDILQELNKCLRKERKKEEQEWGAGKVGQEAEREDIKKGGREGECYRL